MWLGMKGKAYPTCPTCEGRGWYSEPAHDYRCDGSCKYCPVEELVQCQCSSVIIRENPVNETHCRCLNCGEEYLVDESNAYHIQQLCREYCANEFARSLN